MPSWDRDNGENDTCGCPGSPYAHTPACKWGLYKPPRPPQTPAQRAAEDRQLATCLGCGRQVPFGELRETAACKRCRGEKPAAWRTDDAPAKVVLNELLRCALAWEADARILGNVRAGDAARALADAIEAVTHRARLVQLVHDAAGLLDDCGTVTGEDDAQRLRAEADSLR